MIQHCTQLVLCGFLVRFATYVEYGYEGLLLCYVAQSLFEGKDLLLEV